MNIEKLTKPEGGKFTMNRIFLSVALIIFFFSNVGYVTASGLDDCETALSYSLASDAYLEATQSPTMTIVARQESQGGYLCTIYATSENPVTYVSYRGFTYNSGKKSIYTCEVYTVLDKQPTLDANTYREFTSRADQKTWRSLIIDACQQAMQ
jgi:hypothetical protein